jgi:acyl carrier protein
VSRRACPDRIAHPASHGQHFTFFGEPAGDEATLLRNVGRQAQASPRPELGHEYVAARTAVEQQIVGIWQTSLGMKPIGVLDEFFELGGDSVFANQIILQVNRLLGVSITPEDAFDDFTIAHLADIAEQQLTGRPAAAIPEDPCAKIIRACPGRWRWCAERSLPGHSRRAGCDRTSWGAGLVKGPAAGLSAPVPRRGHLSGGKLHRDREGLMLMRVRATGAKHASR